MLDGKISHFRAFPTFVGFCRKSRIPTRSIAMRKTQVLIIPLRDCAALIVSLRDFLKDSRRGYRCALLKTLASIFEFLRAPMVMSIHGYFPVGLNDINSVLCQDKRAGSEARTTFHLVEK